MFGIFKRVKELEKQVALQANLITSLGEYCNELNDHNKIVTPYIVLLKQVCYSQAPSSFDALAKNKNFINQDEIDKVFNNGK